jgi:hypothetical protein
VLSRCNLVGAQILSAKWQDGMHGGALVTRGEVEPAVELSHALPDTGYAHPDSGFVGCAGQKTGWQAAALVGNRQLYVFARAHESH